MNSTKLWLKGALHSLTVWVNGVLGTILLSLPLLQDYLPELEAYLTPQTYKQLLVALIVINIFLRVKTSMSLIQKGQVIEDKKQATATATTKE